MASTALKTASLSALFKTLLPVVASATIISGNNANTTEYEYVIVGSGAGGGTLA
jgi:hypothetical protein